MHVAVAVDVSDNASDQRRLLSMIDTAAEVCAGTPEQVLTDTGYGNVRNPKELDDRGMDAGTVFGREDKAVAKVVTE